MEEVCAVFIDENTQSTLRECRILLKNGHGLPGIMADKLLRQLRARQMQPMNDTGSALKTVFN
jgi:hypothetical protein